MENDVTQVSSPAQQGVTEANPAPQQGNVETSPQQGQTPSAGSEQQYDPNIYDPMGVPWKNRAMEFKRKTEDLASKALERLDNLPTAQQQPQQQYSIEDLEAFAAQTDNPASVAWAKAQIRKIERDEHSKLLEEKLTSWQKQQQNQMLEHQTFNTVIQRNPDLMVRDSFGNIVGWNEKSPMAQRMAMYLGSPELANHPRKYEVAEAFAIRDLYRSQVMPQTQKLQQQVQNLQKQTMVEGGGRSDVQSKTSLQAAKDRLRQTGSLRDAEDAFGEMLGLGN